MPDGDGCAAVCEGDHSLVTAVVGGVIVEDPSQLGRGGHRKVGVALAVHPLLELERGRELCVVQ